VQFSCFFPFYGILQEIKLHRNILLNGPIDLFCKNDRICEFNPEYNQEGMPILNPLMGKKHPACL
jgi:hypothetical protein